MNLRRAFTLVELLVVIAIIAILAAFLFPVFITAKGAVHQLGVNRNIGQISAANSLYMADYDDTFPIAMYWNYQTGLHTWFGHIEDEQGTVNTKEGFLQPYMKAKPPKDQALVAENYLGDDSGIGYNWGVIGSDFHVTGDYTNWPNCQNPAKGSELDNISRTVVFATSAFYNAKWLPDGDGVKYKFGFFDPPSFWNGVPNVDYRHMGKTKIDDANQKVLQDGNAIFGFADGNVRTIRMSETKEKFFWRDQSQFTD
ncbi:MAG: prepilin-type N-terminal cleavage/methylation domain-containing protein [Armatimonadetes bacterium]|nr:prepilin-type N-terminal cleavage/methylation domain-containing protein [Armatimonadota bacterium]